MATQEQPGIAFSIAREQQSFRFMELPDEVVQLLSKPGAPNIRFDSSPSETGASASAKGQHATLWTPNKTYQVRQVQTSNTVFLLRPCLNESADEIRPAGVTAIATVPTTLELLESGAQPSTTSRKWHDRFKKGGG